MGFLRSLIRQRRTRLLVTSLGVALFVGALSFSFATTTTIGLELEGKLVDWRFTLRGEREVPKDIVVLGIDDASDVELGARFPYARDTYADVLRNLEAGGARAVVFDIQFLGNADARNPDATVRDRAFLDALNDVTERMPVVIATDVEVGKEYDYYPMPFEYFTDPAAEPQPDWFDYSGVDTGTTTFDSTAADAVQRTVEPRRELPTQLGQRTIPSLSLAGLAAAEQRSIDDYRDLPRTMLINYYGGTGHFDARPFWWAAQGHKDIVGSERESIVRDRIVLIGATSAALQDLHEIPVSAESSRRRADSTLTDFREGLEGAEAETNLMTGVEIHANALANMRDGSWLTEGSQLQGVIAGFGLVIIIWGLLMVVTPTLGVPLALGAVGLYAWYVQYSFENGVVLPAFGPLSTAACTFITVTTILAVTAVRDRSRVRSLFARYVSPEVVRQLVETEDVIELGGERREITVLFSDIRGFTTLSEHIDPTEMVEQLNTYFAEMVEVIEDQDGMLDKFIGDGLMAIFGAPLEQPDHAKRACLAAKHMLERLDMLNRARRVEGLPLLEMGVGIHTGVAVVGNVGSPRRRVDFTAIGDTVNLASRLEGATKKLGVPVIVSQTTAAQAVPDHDFRQYGSIVVKGRTQATEVFELVLPGSADDVAAVEESGVFAPAPAAEQAERMDDFDLGDGRGAA